MVKLKIKNKEYNLKSNPLAIIISDSGYSCNAISLTFDLSLEEVIAIGFENDMKYSVIDDGGEHDLSDYCQVNKITRHEKQNYTEVIMSQPNSLEDALNIINELI